jgi:hypothetical protein
MLFTRSQLFIACALTSTLLISACSKENSAQKPDALTASAPATGEASTLNERNAQQRLVSTLEKHFKTANINAKILAIKKTEVPNLFWVSLEGMGSVYATSDGQYIIQGDVIRLGEKQLKNVSEALQATENKKHLAALKTEDLIVYPAQGVKRNTSFMYSLIQAALIVTNYMNILPKLMRKALKSVTSHGHVESNLCQPCKRFGVVKIVKLHSIKLRKAYQLHQQNVKTQFVININ